MKDKPIFRSSTPEVFLEKSVLQIYSKFCRRTPIPRCDFHKVVKQLYWNHTSAWVFSCKFAAYFQNTFGGLLLKFELTGTGNKWKANVLCISKINQSYWIANLIGFTTNVIWLNTKVYSVNSEPAQSSSRRVSTQQRYWTSEFWVMNFTKVEFMLK